jgi:superfamily II DNA or RNA helicase
LTGALATSGGPGSRLLGIKPAQRGGGHFKTRGVIDIATLQTLARADDISAFLAATGWW